MEMGEKRCLLWRIPASPWALGKADGGGQWAIKPLARWGLGFLNVGPEAEILTAAAEAEPTCTHF